MATFRKQSQQGLLFERSKKIPEENRTYVSLLKTDYVVYKRALSILIEDWLAGKIGSGLPEDSWERQLIHDVNADVNGATNDIEMDAETQRVYDELVYLKVPGNLKIVTSHRRWLRRCQKLCEKIGVNFSGDMDALMRIHDLSKYTHREVLGYAVMFGDGSKAWRTLEIEDENKEWQTTLNNHYAANPHHPEYFGLVKPGEQQTNSMVDMEKEDGMLFLEESVIDMLASNGERNLAGDDMISVTKCMNIIPRYLGRYAPDDRLLVEELLEKWRILAIEYMADEQNIADLHKHFDDRLVSV